jgi:bifunctional non-homologous end joining protein LigD
LLVPHPLPFIIPAQSALRDRPPTVDAWLHEVKFDGYRVQLHKIGHDVNIYSRNGADFSSRFSVICHAFKHFPARNVILDAELVAFNAKGMPDFFALHGRRAQPEEIGCWAFDLLRHNSKDTRLLPLEKRRSTLSKLIETFDNGYIRFSESFTDADRLLATCEVHGLEGIVSKRRDAPYRSGKCDWIKVKTKAWREANKNRGELFNP